jgi:flavin-dependent dehydrogenase
MQKTKKYDVVVIGGGLSGLISSILLQKAGINVLLIEKKIYPFHRVCGEYVSNEVLHFLNRNDLSIDHLSPSSISQFEISAISGKKMSLDLDLGGFGISRYNFDNFLYQKAVAQGVDVLTDEVSGVSFEDNQFEIRLKNNSAINCEIAIGAFGKRSNLDSKLSRSFFTNPSPYIGVKYHIKCDIDKTIVALHNFEGGYCGINAIENNTVNLCYLSHRESLKKHKSIEDLEKNVLHKNPILKEIFNTAEHLWERPEVINEISFETKSLVENHILMCGDSAGMITPLCGNGMAIAIHSAKILCEEIIDYYNGERNRLVLEKQYTKRWNNQFKLRLSVGRNIQKLFGSGQLSELTVAISKFKPMANYLIKQTHGQPF